MPDENVKVIIPEQVIHTINEFLQDEFEVNASRIVPSANMRATLDLDSLDYIDLVVAMEKNLHIKADPSDLMDIHTIQDLYDYVLLQMRTAV